MAVKARTWKPTIHVAGRARLDMARAKLPEGQFQAVPAKTLGKVGCNPSRRPQSVKIVGRLTL